MVKRDEADLRGFGDQNKSMISREKVQSAIAVRLKARLRGIQCPPSCPLEQQGRGRVEGHPDGQLPAVAVGSPGDGDAAIGTFIGGIQFAQTGVEAGGDDEYGGSPLQRVGNQEDFATWFKQAAEDIQRKCVD